MTAIWASWFTVQAAWYSQKNTKVTCCIYIYNAARPGNEPYYRKRPPRRKRVYWINTPAHEQYFCPEKWCILRSIMGNQKGFARQLAGKTRERVKYSFSVGKHRVVGTLGQSSAPSILRNFVPSEAAHEAAAGHALDEPSDNYTAGFNAGFSRTSTILWACFFFNSAL